MGMPGSEGIDRRCQGVRALMGMPGLWKGPGAVQGAWYYLKIVIFTYKDLLQSWLGLLCIFCSLLIKTVNVNKY